MFLLKMERERIYNRVIARLGLKKGDTGILALVFYRKSRQGKGTEGGERERE